MTVVTTREFNTNQKRYFDLAKNESIVIRRGKTMFHLTQRPIETQYPEQEILAPDDDLRNGIAKEEFKERTHKIVQIFFANK
jgi:hypothetical protein